MNPTDILVNEHRVIEQVAHCLEKMAERCASTQELDAQAAEDAVAFFETFVQGWHFPREEAYLSIVAAEESGKGLSTVELPLPDHQRCRLQLRELREAAEAVARGDLGATDRFAEGAQSYLTVLMSHVEEEEDRLFPRFDRMLSDQRKRDAAEVLCRGAPAHVDQHQVEQGVQLANRLADRFNVPRIALAVLPARGGT